MADKEKAIKKLKEVLDNLDITNKYRLNLIETIEYLQKEPVSEELEEASKEYGIRQGAELRPFATKFFKAGANWQKEKDKETIELAEDHAMLACMNKMEQQMMSKAIVREVKVDAGGYPYIDATELYDYDKDMPLAKEGDKVKVIIIKED